MKVAIVGSRDFTDYERFKKAIEGVVFEGDTIISGGARGADSLARRYAVEKGLQYVELPAQWETYGKSAGFRRNQQIVEEAEFVVAFWDYESKGTKSTIDLAIKSEKLIYVIGVKSER